MLDYTWRLAGVTEQDDSLDWKVRPGHPAAQSPVFRLRTDEGKTAEMKYDSRGAELRLGSRMIARGESRMARLVTDCSGGLKTLVGISEQPQKVIRRLAGIGRKGSC
ncbi:MAG TPA: hypothetical protein VGN17_10125 [Bryobacteraceae bacterium]